MRSESRKPRARSVVTRWVWLLGLAVSLCGLACDSFEAASEAGSPATEGTPARNVLLITVDTLRPDRLSAYGYPGHETPSFDRLAREGVLFENAFCDVTWTTPSMASVMTGTYASTHGVRSSFRRLSDDATTLASLVRSAGAQTAAIVGSFPVHSTFGFAKGFDYFDEDFARSWVPSAAVAETRQWASQQLETLGLKPDEMIFAEEDNEIAQAVRERLYANSYRSDAEVSDRAIEWLRTQARAPFFLWLHYLGPHEKTHADLKDIAELQQRQRDEYDGDVLEADAQVGRVLAELDALGLWPSTADILHSDHGQSLTEHGYFGHGRNLYDPTQRVPLIVRAPDADVAGRRVSRLVRNLDVFPTVLDLFEIEHDGGSDGESLLRTARGEPTKRPDETYVETYLSATSMLAEPLPNGKGHVGFRRTGVRTPAWKFVANEPIPLVDRRNPPPVAPELRRRHFSEELYDLRADPGETTNVIAEHPEQAAALRARMAHYRTRDPDGPSSEPIDLDATSRERLRSLGYLE